MHLKVVFLFCSQAKLQKLHQAPLWIVISVIPQLLEWIRFRLWLTQFTILNIWFLQTQSPELTASGKNMAINIYYSPRNCILHYFNLKIFFFLFSCLSLCIIMCQSNGETVYSIITNIVFSFIFMGFLFSFLVQNLHLFDLIHLCQIFVSIYYVSKNVFLLLYVNHSSHQFLLTFGIYWVNLGSCPHCAFAMCFTSQVCLNLNWMFLGTESHHFPEFFVL